jgi:Tol biopolymer transport system component
MLQLTTDPTPDWYPQWSPTGDRIAFWAHRSGNRDIWVMPAEGGTAQQITSHPAEDFYPAWSPDGTQIAFSSLRSGNRDVWIVAADGGAPHPVTVDPREDQGATWSVNGRWLVFSSSRDGWRGLWRIPVEGGEPELLTKGPGTNPFRWSADGKLLYNTGWQERGGNFWAFSLEDGREYPLTALVGRRGTPGWALATDDRFLYSTWREDVSDIWVMDVAR